PPVAAEPSAQPGLLSRFFGGLFRKDSAAPPVPVGAAEAAQPRNQARTGDTSRGESRSDESRGGARSSERARRGRGGRSRGNHRGAEHSERIDAVGGEDRNRTANVRARRDGQDEAAQPAREQRERPAGERIERGGRDRRRRGGEQNAERRPRPERAEAVTTDE